MGFTAAVAGASGYAGGEVLRLLANHPAIEPTTFTAHSNAGQTLGAVQPHLRSLADATFIDTTAQNLAGHDIVFFALPHGMSGDLAVQLSALSPDTLLIDCGADHRLHKEEAWEAFYGGPFNEPWTYGVPELVVGGKKQRENIVGTKRIAAPGCNASTVSLSMVPGVVADLIDPTDLVSVLAVGPSGAGKSLRVNLLASEILGSATPYAVGGIHRHIPEIEQALDEAVPSPLKKEAARQQANVSFTPVLVPMARGILATTTAPVRPGVTEQMLRDAWEEVYGEEPFVQVLPEGEHPATASTIGANTLLMSVTLDKHAGRVVVVAALDNLAKGTAGAAVQSANIALGLPEDSGLTVNGVAP